MGVGVGSDAVTPEELIRRNVQARSPLEIRMLLQVSKTLVISHSHLGILSLTTFSPRLASTFTSAHLPSLHNSPQDNTHHQPCLYTTPH
ncbi:hypothetical protein Pmani_013285 [Petrolisthes manimaculis]|uniref:Uncharacterized protein n=1 Tax=Petrolisthes manimaculis TaxID=1843537 RepID=A0AAE1U9H4_9EUCA|nr:hypothetical protein Pmani_013285 [Petrolisthes manimaculis]